jgi:hypothetical protein
MAERARCPHGVPNHWRCAECGESRSWPTRPVELNHLEAMSLCMSLMAEEDRDGLSQPQRTALVKVQATLSLLMDDLGQPS